MLVIGLTAASKSRQARSQNFGINNEPGPGPACARWVVPIVGNGEGVWSWLHIEDAAIATVAAAEQGNPGIYLIANDQPLAVREWLPAFAQWLNAPHRLGYRLRML